MYYTLLYPYLTYGIVLWGSAYKCHTNEILIHQKRAVRIVCNAKYNDYYNPLFISLKILKFEFIYKLGSCKLLVFKFYNNHLSRRLNDLFVSNEHVYMRELPVNEGICMLKNAVLK